MYVSQKNVRIKLTKINDILITMLRKMEKMHPSCRLIHIAEIRKTLTFMTWSMNTFKDSQVSFAGSSTTRSFGQVCRYLN